jgi:hypothetical protein
MLVVEDSKSSRNCPEPVDNCSSIPALINGTANRSCHQPPSLILRLSDAAVPDDPLDPKSTDDSRLVDLQSRVLFIDC